MRLRDFSNYKERQARRVLMKAFEGTGYWVNEKTRLEDVIEPDDDDDPADKRFLRDSHFDFTVHKESRHKVLWAFEYDGPTHQTPEQRRRDVRKNRVCLLAGLPLLRIDDTHLNANEKQAVLDWHVKRWLAYEKTMPQLLEDRDREIAAIPEEDIRSAGPFLLGDYPHLDVEFIFELENPYQPSLEISKRLMEKYGVMDTNLWDKFHEEGVRTGRIQYLVRMDFLGAVQDLHRTGFHSRWVCPIRVERYDGYITTTSREPEVAFQATGVWEARVAYPVQDRPEPVTNALVDWAAAGGFLPAGPWGGGAHEVGKVLAEYNALREVELWAERDLRTRRVG